MKMACMIYVHSASSGMLHKHMQLACTHLPTWHHLGFVKRVPRLKQQAFTLVMLWMYSGPTRVLMARHGKKHRSFVMH